MKLLATILIIAGLASCKLLEKTYKERGNTTTASKVDTTHIAKSDSGRKETGTYDRTTINGYIPVPTGRDTIINNTTVPVYNYYPTKYVHESGTFTKEDWLRMTDSMNRAKQDTTHAVTEVKDKSTKVSVLSPIQIIGLVALAYIVLSILGYGIKKFKIVKL